LKELNMQFPGTRLELDNNATIMEYEKMSDAKFNKAHEVKKPID